MRPRLVFIVVMAVLMAAFAGLNWSEFNQVTPLSFGLFTTDAALGMTMLFALGLTLLVFLLSSAIHESRFVLHTHKHTKALDAQRNLADKAEASRFTDLRQQLDNHLRETRQREQLATTEFEKVAAQHHRDLRAHMEQMHRALTTRLGELESHIEARLDRGSTTSATSATAAPTMTGLPKIEPIVDDVPTRDRVKL